MADIRLKFDYVGSFLRPEKLKEARAAFEEGKISAADLKRVEDECIEELIAKQKELGYGVITDGEFRRATWHLDFMWGFEGVGHKKTATGLPFHDEAAMIDDTYLTGKFRAPKEHPFVEHFKFVQNFEDENTFAKQTIPAPAQVFAQFWMPVLREPSLQFYKDENELAKDLTSAYTEVCKQLYDAGCRHLQLDDCTWGMLADDKGHLAYGVSKEESVKIQEFHKNLNNAVIDALPKDMDITTHICRGNFHSTYANSGPYDSVAKVLFAGENVNSYYLEFDDARSGGFEPLKYVSEDKKVVLGLVTTKRAGLERKEALIERVKAAAKYVPLERLSISPQCGFASCEIGNKLDFEDQWKKLKLVKEVAEEVFA